MKKRILSILKIVVPIGIGVFLVFYTYNQFTEQQLQEIKGYFINANYFYLFLSAFFAVVSHLSRAWRWNYLLSPMGHKASYVNNILAVMVAYLLNLLIPRSGEVSRAAIIHKYEKVPFEKAMGTIITERIIDLFILIILCLIAVFSQMGIFIQYFEEKNFSYTNILIYAFVFLLIVVLGGLILKKGTHPFLEKIRTFFRGFKEGILSLFSIKQKWGFTIHTLVIWIMYILMFYVSIFALKETSDISFNAIVSSFAVGAIAIAFTNGGFGAYPFLVGEILLLYDVPFAVGIAFGWMVWLMQFILIVSFGGISFILLPFYNSRKK